MKATLALTPATLLSALALVALPACGGSQKPEAESARTKTTSAALSTDGEDGAEASEKAEQTAAEKWAESKIANDTPDTKTARPAGEALDPLSEGASLEAANIPKIERADKKQVRAKSRGELDAAMSVMKTAATVEEAVTKLTARLGKANWVENGSKHIWIANDGARCHRLVLEGDGSLNLETVAKSDVLRLTTTVRQNPCTGEIERGGTN